MDEKVIILTLSMNYGVLWFKREVLVILVKGFLKISVTLFEVEIDYFLKVALFYFWLRSR